MVEYACFSVDRHRVSGHSLRQLKRYFDLTFGRKSLGNHVLPFMFCFFISACKHRKPGHWLRDIALSYILSKLGRIENIHAEPVVTRFKTFLSSLCSVLLWTRYTALLLTALSLLPLVQAMGSSMVLHHAPVPREASASNESN